MSAPHIVFSVALGLILLHWLGGFCLDHLNQREVESHRGAVPTTLRNMIDPVTHAKSTEYTLAKLRLGGWEEAWGTVVLIAVLASGLLPAWYARWGLTADASAWKQAAWLLATAVLLGLTSLPFDWWSQFRLEERFGFNTTTPTTWLIDRLKGLLLAGAIGFPLLMLLLKWVNWMGSHWWIWAWVTLFAVQLLLLILAPILILPLFNRFTPLPDGTLRERLLQLGEKTGFSARTIQVMDGSKRSRHSNAYFTGFGRFRKIVLFDTLVGQLTEPELEAVLAHEIGHYKRGHIPQRLLWAAVSSLAAFALIGWLARQSWFLAAFGFPPNAGVAPALLLFMLLGSAVTFWFSPLGNLWSRHHEYEADRYAREAVGGADPLIGALRKLSEKNLTNLTPHPWYSGFHYSHPTLVEREAALR
ncbi:MAG: M48 family peptidase [Pedosphaera sp.]|nr:M48 family peptidase [Pedosphaera sp.]